MGKLLIPIDFSEDSRTAVHYACELATQAGQSIELLHVFSEHTNTYVNVSDEKPLEDPRVPQAKRTMEEVIGQVRSAYPSLAVEGFFREGNLYEEIKKMTNATSYDAVVMGTDGASGLEAVFIGSNTYDTIMNTTTPVLAIPNSAKEFKKHKIALLCNFKEAELVALKQALPLFKNDFQLMLVHINTSDRAIKDIDNDFKAWIDQIIDEVQINDITYIIKPQSLFLGRKESVANAITSVLIDEQVDVLVLTKSKKSVFRQWTEGNVIKKLAFNIQIPTFFARVLIAK